MSEYSTPKIDQRLHEVLHRMQDRVMTWPEEWCDEVAPRYVSDEEREIIESITDDEVKAGTANRRAVGTLDLREVMRIILGTPADLPSAHGLRMLEDDPEAMAAGETIRPAAERESPYMLGELIRRTRPVMEHPGFNELTTLDPIATQALREVYDLAVAAMNEIGWEVDQAGTVKRRTEGRPQLLLRQVAANLYRYLAECRERLGRPQHGNLAEIRRDVVDLMRPFYPDVTDEQVRQAVSARLR